MKDLFFSIHNHLEFSNIGSFLDSTIKAEQLLLRANELNYKGVAITDHGCLSSHIQVLNTEKELKKKGKLPQDFTVALGVEAYVVNEEEMNNAVQQQLPTSFYHMILVAKDEIGHKQLRKLTSLSYKRSFTYRGILRVPMFYSDFAKVIGEDKGHLIVTSACLGGFMGKTVTEMLKHDESQRTPFKQAIKQFMTWALDMFGEDFYLEIQPSYGQEQRDYNEMLVKISRAYQVPLIVATDTHYLNKEDKAVHEAFLLSDKKGVGGREIGDFYDDTYLHSVEEIRLKLNNLDEDAIQQSLNNTVEVASKINYYDLQQPQIIPKIPLPPKVEWFVCPSLYEQAKKYENIQQMIESEEIYDNYLINLAFKGMVEKNIPETKIAEKLERLNTECYELIGITKAKGQPISAYFITMAKCIDLIWESGSIVGTSRGSGAGYELNYLLGITQVSPLEQGIEMPHWRSKIGRNLW